MGLDMFIFKIKRFENATLDDVGAVESYLELQRHNTEHPEKKYSMKEWCGHEKPSDELIEYYSELVKRDKYGFINIKEEVAYWRKANAIHQWFVDNVQNGKDDCDVHRELTKSDLLTLRDLAHEVLCDPDKAEELLPTQSGFFFGSTEYDEWYMEDLKSTIDQLDEIIKNTDFNTEALYYVSSW